MTLNEAVATIGLPQVDGCASAFSQTGEKYVVIVSGGLKAEGVRCPILCSTEELAIKFWLDAFNEYTTDKAGTIYWRVRPELGSWKIRQADIEGIPDDLVYVVYSRLLISDKPVLAEAA